MISSSPYDFHCHGIGNFDFTHPSDIVLEQIQSSLYTENVNSIITIYLLRNNIEDFEDFVAVYYDGKLSGKYPNIVGIALEGPFLSSIGGTPRRGCWTPTINEWLRLFKLGHSGLIYIVISPDAEIPAETDYPPNMIWIIDNMLNNGVIPALGHFQKDNPAASAEKTRLILEHVKNNYDIPIVTDHLFNDMPLNFKKAWRTFDELQNRTNELQEILDANWTFNNMYETLGDVPATIIEYARQGVVKVCVNFDGNHVDIEICKKAIDLIGSENLLLMTDRIQSKVLGGQYLIEKFNNTLLYQSDGIVAGGSQSVMRLLANMMQCHIASSDIYNIAFKNPFDYLNTIHDYKNSIMT